MTAGAIERDSPARSAATASDNDSLAVFVARSVVPGCVATALVAVGAIGLGWLPMQRALLSMPVIHALQSTAIGTAFAAVSLVTGIVLLMFAWLQVGNDVARGQLSDVRRMWIALAAWSAPLVLTPPLFSRDAYSYVAQGRLFLSGHNPYTHAPSELPDWSAAGVDPLWANTPSPYGQVFNVLARGVADIGGANSYLSALLFRVLALVGVGLLAWAVPQLARNYGINPAWALWLGVLNPLVVMHFVSGAHNDALMVGLIAAGFAFAVRRQPMLGVVLVTLAGGVKPIGLVALPFVGLIWAGPKAPISQIVKRWAASLAVCAAILVLLAMATGTGFGWVNAIGTSSSVRTWLSPPTALGLTFGMIGDLAGLDLTRTLVAISRGTAAIVAGLAIAYLCLRPADRNPVRAAGLSFLVLVILGPVVQPWYLLWSLPLLAAAGLSKRETKWVIYGTFALAAFSLASHFLDGAGYT